MTQATSQQRTTQPSYFGGIFSPLAQYPGASYARILSDKIEQNSFAPRKTKREKILVRSHEPYLRSMSKNSLPFESALLLVDLESNASLDRAALRDAGIRQVQVLTSGLQAAKVLSNNNAEKQIDIVFCHARFEDMTAAQWIELIRLHPKLLNIPIVALVGSSVEEKFLQNMDFTALMTRPYSPKALHDQLVSIKHISTEPSDISHLAFDAALYRYECCATEEGKAAFYLEEGLRFVQQKEWDNAIQSFNKAILDLSQKGDAELGLAAAWRGKQDVEKFRYYVYEAGLTFTRAGQWAKSRTAYTYMLKVVPNAPSPFVRTAQSYIRAGEYAKAATTLVKGLDLSSHENITAHIVKACLYTENPPHTLKKVKQFFIDPSLQDVVKGLDITLQKALTAHKDTVARGREEKARLEQKAKDYRKAQQQKTGPAPQLAFEPEIDDDFGSILADYDEESDESILESIPGKPSLMQDDYVKKAEQEGVLPLMTADDMESQLFTKFPKLNEAATVIKTTLKLMKK